LSQAYEMAECYRSLNEGQDLSEIQCRELRKSAPADFQLISLAIKLLYKTRNAAEESLLAWVVTEHPLIRGITSYLFAGELPIWPHTPLRPAPQLDEDEMRILMRIKEHEPIGIVSFSRFLKRYLTAQMPRVAMASALALSTMRDEHEPASREVNGRGLAFIAG